MAAVDSFDTKKVFFLFQIGCGGGGAALSRPLWERYRCCPQVALSLFQKTASGPKVNAAFITEVIVLIWEHQFGEMVYKYGLRCFVEINYLHFTSPYIFQHIHTRDLRLI